MKLGWNLLDHYQTVICKCPSTVIKLVFIELYSFISNLQFFDGALRNRKNVITPLKNLVNGSFLRTWHSVIIWFGLFNQYCQKYQRCHLPSIKIFDTVDYSLNWNLSNNFSLIYYNSYLTHFITTNYHLDYIKFYQ